MATLVLYDFDGTLTKQDSLWHFLRFASPSTWAFTKKMLGFLPIYLRYRMGLQNNHQSKEQLLSLFFKDKTVEEMQALGASFAEQVLPKLLVDEKMAQLHKHVEHDREVVLVSASLELYLQPWCNAMGIGLIGTKLADNNGVITGKYDGKNCWGPEKARRVKAQFHLEEYHHILAYGDSRGDKEMLMLQKNTKV